MGKETTRSKRGTASDLTRVDAHKMSAQDYQEIPELPEDFFDRADYHEGGKLVRRGRPPRGPANRKGPLEHE